MHAYSSFLSEAFVVGPLLFLFIGLSILALVLKGFSLWYSARSGQKWWFIALLLVNSLGILEAVYLIWFRPKSDAIVPMNSSSSAQ